ncbi:GAF and ANTAR domain-containing protein [Streptomyces flavofungini]|uniref:ANTAR domain-containing protein n=1 Tax=Streptomyces flavofungini TaxID=68200 RepID=A0ABS0X762_9ACTN|nr:GAF domain-containing protein [Streptomyces flavofungini]MBJ3809039.1 ANTAR domain-containing protein [Streptomyces flavofungini]GHC68249.1 transcription antitermination regulator [Streptomyces flavofungini]
MRQDPLDPTPTDSGHTAGAPPATYVIPAPRQHDVALRNRQLAHACVARAQDVLIGRYRLGATRMAFDLLRRTSQQMNIKLHTLADAVIRVPGPDADAELWFPGRARYRPPPLPSLAQEVGDRTGHGAVLKSTLRRVLHVTQAGMGNVQVAEHRMLRMERHTGLSREFTDFFAFVQDSTTACAQAAQEGRQVTVKDVAVAEIFDEDSRRAILRAGSRACHSVPLTAPGGAVLGMISSHHARPLSGFTRSQLDELDAVGEQVGRWLAWHRNTRVLDALEHLHAAATTAR